MVSDLAAKWVQFIYGLNALERRMLVYATLGAGMLLFAFLERRRRAKRK